MTWRTTRLDGVALRAKRPLDPQLLGDRLVDHYSIPSLESTGGPELVPAIQIMSAKQLLKGGEVMLSRLNPRKARVIAVPDGPRTALASGEFVVMQPHGVEPRFLTYLLLSETVRQYLDSRVQSVTRSHQRVRPEVLMKMNLLIPDRHSQRAIADYLDTEISRIDTLITKKRRMIELLDHRLVSFATYLINGNDQSQQSGIPSIPYIPRRWRSLRNKVFMHEISERSSTGDEELLSVSHLTGVTPRSVKTVYMFKAESMVGYKLVQPGDLAVNTMWAWMGAAGVSRHHGIVSPSYGVYRIDQATVLPGYFDLLVRTPAYICEMTRYSRGVTSSRLRLYPDELLALRTPVPPMDEQDTIVQRFEGEAYKARSAIDALHRQVALLTERRQTLITAAVTGEFAVPAASG